MKMMQIFMWKKQFHQKMLAKQYDVVTTDHDKKK